PTGQFMCYKTGQIICCLQPLFLCLTDNINSSIFSKKQRAIMNIFLICCVCLFCLFFTVFRRVEANSVSFPKSNKLVFLIMASAHCLVLDVSA
ncbi:MAG TPA: hypothetical protein PKW17_10095, partial [Smithellaceae bacterium]|nr:hypothetical protein [Smithellaceae bacterium]